MVLPFLIMLFYLGLTIFLVYFIVKVIRFMNAKNAQDRRTAEVLEDIARKLSERG
ncbi:hypothetical protein MO973_07655 [Paenibacillus sp. TRM 82003]|nr:hypothetical protein [Paenibacillus sp. TRM 82003]